jgi:Transcriptional repressor TCF25
MTNVHFLSSLSAPDAALHLLSHLYVQRSAGIWKDPSYSSWFSQTLTALYPSALPSSLPKSAQRTAFLTLFNHATPQASVHRHILVLEATYRRLFSFIPRANLPGAGTLACDPLPPATAVSRYDISFFEGVEDAFASGGRRARSRRERALDERRLAQVIPDAAFRRQLQVRFFLYCVRVWCG